MPTPMQELAALCSAGTLHVLCLKHGFCRGEHNFAVLCGPLLGHGLSGLLLRVQFGCVQFVRLPFVPGPRVFGFRLFGSGLAVGLAVAWAVGGGAWLACGD